MNTYRILRSRQSLIQPGSTVTWWERSHRMIGIVIRREHDHFLIEDHTGYHYRILHEKVESLTARQLKR